MNPRLDHPKIPTFPHSRRIPAFPHSHIPGFPQDPGPVPAAPCRSISRVSLGRGRGARWGQFLTPREKQDLGKTGSREKNRIQGKNPPRIQRNAGCREKQHPGQGESRTGNTQAQAAPRFLGRRGWNSTSPWNLGIPGASSLPLPLPAGTAGPAFGQGTPPGGPRALFDP